MLEKIEILRPFNCAMASFGVVVGALLVLTKYEMNLFAAATPLLFAIVAAAMITGAGNAINDYADIEIDRINKPHRPIPSGRMERNTAAWMAASFFAAGIILASFINVWALAIAAANSMLLVAYAFSLKHKPLVGNAVVSCMVGSTFLFGGAAMGDLLLPGLIAVMAFLTNMGRELVKSVEDETGDRWYALKKIVSSFSRAKFGEREKRLIAVLSLTLAILISPLPYYLGLLHKFPYLGAVALADIVFFYCALKLVTGKKKVKELRLVSKLIKLGMLLGIAAFFAGVMV